MQDRFKFRAWNKLSNEMKDVISLNINYEFPDCSNVILETNTFDNIKTHNNPITCANGLNNVVLMQCTGLKDKNNNLIYEGDIINIWCKNLTKNQISDVFYCEERAAFCFHYETDYGNIVPCTMDKTEIEVIGNIYENPELRSK